MERRGLIAALAGLAVVLASGAASAQTSFYYYGTPGYNPYQYPYPDRDGYARFDLNCVEAGRLLGDEGFQVIDAIRCQRHLPFVYLAVRRGKQYRVTISQFDGEIISVARAEQTIRNSTKKRRKRKKN